MSETMESRDRPAIHPVEFWTDYQPTADGKMEPHDWVRWVKKGVSNGATTEDKIGRVQKHDPGIWDIVRPYYEAWQKGNDAPDSGTPLDAMPFMTRELVKVLRGVHIRTVEDLDVAEDAALAKLGVPGIRSIQSKARAFLDAQRNTAGVASELAALREQVAALTAEKNEIGQTADALAADAGRRRGRPPRSVSEQLAPEQLAPEE